LGVSSREIRGTVIFGSRGADLAPEINPKFFEQPSLAPRSFRANMHTYEIVELTDEVMQETLCSPHPFYGTEHDVKVAALYASLPVAPLNWTYSSGHVALTKEATPICLWTRVTSDNGPVITCELVTRRFSGIAHGGSRKYALVHQEETTELVLTVPSGSVLVGLTLRAVGFLESNAVGHDAREVSLMGVDRVVEGAYSLECVTARKCLNRLSVDLKCTKLVSQVGFGAPSRKTTLFFPEFCFLVAGREVKAYGPMLRVASQRGVNQQAERWGDSSKRRKAAVLRKSEPPACMGLVQAPIPTGALDLAAAAESIAAEVMDAEVVSDDCIDLNEPVTDFDI
jgi:hypothetical protein